MNNLILKKQEARVKLHGSSSRVVKSSVAVVLGTRREDSEAYVACGRRRLSGWGRAGSKRRISVISLLIRIAKNTRGNTQIISCFLSCAVAQ